jgi:hypothetical protein
MDKAPMVMVMASNWVVQDNLLLTQLHHVLLAITKVVVTMEMAILAILQLPEAVEQVIQKPYGIGFISNKG